MSKFSTPCSSKNWSIQNIAWAAGLFEGEGSISIKPQSLQLQLGMTDQDVIRKFREIIGVGTVHGPYQDKRKAHFKPTYVWQCSGFTRCQAVLAAFWDHLGLRRKKKAHEALVFGSKLLPHASVKRHCLHGHEFTEENTYRPPDGLSRMCRACMKLTSIKQAAIKKERRRLAKCL